MQSKPTMRRAALAMTMTALVAVLGRAPAAAASGGFHLEVIVDGRPLPHYVLQDRTYIEALAGKEYAIRITNPLGVRVAVALSVDGLNTIDARRTTAAGARKWVIEPYDTITISGWQTGGDHARRFYFTTESGSYAQWMGSTENAGVIAAVFFRERGVRAVPGVTEAPRPSHRDGGAADAGAKDERGRTESADASAAPSAPSAAAEAARPVLEDEYAATGIGDRVRHRVEQVFLDLEPRPVATLALRYEYRPQLVRLGVLPPSYPADPLARRQRARGFEPGFCPEPPR